MVLTNKSLRDCLESLIVVVVEIRLKSLVVCMLYAGLYVCVLLFVSCPYILYVCGCVSFSSLLPSHTSTYVSVGVFVCLGLSLIYRKICLKSLLVVVVETPLMVFASFLSASE